MIRFLNFSQWFLIILKVFIEKFRFTHTLKRFGLWKIHSQLYKKKAKSISTFDFNTTLYTTIPHNLLIKFLSKIIFFFSKSKTRSCVDIPKTSIYWTSKGCGRRYLKRQTLMPSHFSLQNAIFHWKPEVQTKDWHSYGHRPSSIFGKPLSIFFLI